jgi:hypothetical protein
MLTMLRHPIIISSLALVLALVPTTVQSAATFTTLISCEDITTDEETFRVCSTYGVTSPNPATDANGTTTDIGGWDYYFNIYTAAAEDMSEGKDDIPPQAYANITVHVSRSGDDDVCNVTVKTDGVETVCSSCTYCGNETDNYSADCTNMEHGRVVDCESTDILYFPLTSAALPNVTITDDAPPPFPSNTSGGGAPVPSPSTTSDSPSQSIKGMMMLVTTMMSSLIILALV